jgi:hypothetical protein
VEAKARINIGRASKANEEKLRWNMMPLVALFGPLLHQFFTRFPAVKPPQKPGPSIEFLLHIEKKCFFFLRLYWKRNFCFFCFSDQHAKQPNVRR